MQCPECKGRKFIVREKGEEGRICVKCGAVLVESMVDVECPAMVCPKDLVLGKAKKARK